MPNPTILTLALSADGNTLHAAGELDLTTKPAFVQALSPLLTHLVAAAHRDTNADAPHLDFTALAFMDSAGLEALVFAYRQLAQCGCVLHLRLLAGSQPARVLRIGRFGRIFHLDFVEKGKDTL